jgi:antitoxin VapB
MAERLRRLVRARSKTEAVRHALANAIEAAGGRPSLAARIEEAVAMARRIGARDAEFDQNAFGDEMWDL